MSDFLPSDYKEPVMSNYMSFEQGENKFRVLSKPIIGWEYWVDVFENGKQVFQNGKPKRTPVRVRQLNEVPMEFQNSPDRQKQPKHFWAMVVWNYGAERIQVLEITQKRIRESLKTLFADPDWGAPFGYDIAIKKEGEGLSTEYQTNPKPKKELDSEISKLYRESNVNLEALFEGADPFSGEEIREPLENQEEVDLDQVPEHI